MDQLSRQLDETEAMLRRKKAHVAQAIAAGAQASVGELSAITSLEVRIANLRSLLRARDLSREMS